VFSADARLDRDAAHAEVPGDGRQRPQSAFRNKGDAASVALGNEELRTGHRCALRGVQLRAQSDSCDATQLPTDNSGHHRERRADFIGCTVTDQSAIHQGRPAAEWRSCGAAWCLATVDRPAPRRATRAVQPIGRCVAGTPAGQAPRESTRN